MYCAPEDIYLAVKRERVAEATSDNSDPDLDIVQNAIRKSSALIDIYISNRYKVPLLQTPDIIKDVCVDLSICAIYSMPMDVEVNEGVKARYENAISILKQIKNGELALFPDSKSGNDYSVLSTNEKPIFTLNMGYL